MLSLHMLMRGVVEDYLMDSSLMHLWPVLFGSRVLGPGVLEGVSSTLNRWTNHLIPVWNPYIPKVSSRKGWN